ncbi:MAG TPA: gamma-glutamyl-gamma-aminobutyrate hydrolase family protein, partial [Tepidisphaeraceae bacterium]
MGRPLIGITLDYLEGKPRYMLPQAYMTAVEMAGGLPFGLPFKTDLALIPEIVDRLDGILFSGGDDLDPALYGD